MKDIIQGLWIGEELSNIERLCIASFLYFGSEFHLYTYGEVKGIPEGTVLKNANEIIPKSGIFKNKKGSLAIFADWFRFELLYKKGGFYVDMDMICLKPFDFEKEDIVYGKETGDTVSNAIMKFPKGSPICRHMADICMSPNKILPYDKTKHKLKKIRRRYLEGNKRGNTEWGEAGGPTGLTRYLAHHNMTTSAKPFYFFFPIHYNNWKSIFDSTFKNNKDYFAGSYAVHLWNEKIRKHGMNKNENFLKNSFIEHLKYKYTSSKPLSEYTKGTC